MARIAEDLENGGKQYGNANIKDLLKMTDDYRRSLPPPRP